MSAALTELYLEISPGERRAAGLDEGGVLSFFAIDRDSRPQYVEGIYLARVRKVEKAMNVAFLDIGIGEDALLNRPGPLKEGEAVIVQVNRDPRSGKGTSVTRRPMLWDRYLAFQPDDGGVNWARGLGQGRMRAETEARVSRCLPDAAGFTVRGPAGFASEAAIVDTAERLKARWAAIEASVKEAEAARHVPKLIEAAPEFAFRMVRDAPGECRIAIDDRQVEAAIHKTARNWPDLENTIALYADPAPIFDSTGISDALEDVFAREVLLVGGGRITIDTTEALTAIDVDTGKGSAIGGEEAAHKLNRRAAEEVARQILLRNLSGLIVVDFLKTKGRGRLKQLLDVLRSRLKRSTTATDVLGITAPDAVAADCLRRAVRIKGAGVPVAYLGRSAISVLEGAMVNAKAEVDRRLGQPLVLREQPEGASLRVEMERH